MKRIYAMGASLIMTCMAGAASAATYNILEPVGPAPTGPSAPVSGGNLQVYSARERAPIDPNLEEFFANEYGKNECLYEKAHTGYVIYAPDGQIIKKIKNARGLYDEIPALVTLPAGTYKIEALGELNDGEVFKTNIPIVIKSGQMTVIHLESDWRPAGKTVDPQSVVRMYDGRMVGWRADNRTASVSR
jgi:hypothetical protein